MRLRRILPRLILLSPFVSFPIPAVALAAATSTAAAQSGDQRAGADGARQIQAVADEKRARPEAHKKIDSQLLHALKQRRGERRAAPTAPVDIAVDAGGR